MLAWTRTAGGVCAVCALVGCGLERRKIPIRMGRARSEGEDTIFDYTEKQLTDRWADFKRKLLKKGTIKKDLTMHDLRHESLSRLFEINNSNGEGALSFPEIVQISGHKDANTLINTYVKVDPLKTVEKMRAVGA